MQVQTRGIRACKEELEYRNSAALNEDMPGKSLQGLSSLKVFRFHVAP